MQPMRRWIPSTVACVLLSAAVAWSAPDATQARGAAASTTPRVDGPFRVYEHDGWRLEVGIYGDRDVRLLAPQPAPEEAAAGRALYSGQDLDAILAAHPQFQKETALQALRQAATAGERPEPTACTWTARIRDADLVYETWRGASAVRLIVPRAGTERLFEGADLGAILHAHPDLVSLRGIDGIRKRIAELERMRLSTDGAPADGAPGGAPLHLDLEMTPGVVKASVWKKAASGRWESQVYSGSDLEALQTVHGTLAAQLPRWVQGAEQGEKASRSLEVKSLGLRVDAEPAPAGGDGASQLVIRAVVAGGRAADLGARVGDVLIAIDGTEVHELQEASDAFDRTLGMKDPRITLRVRRGDRILTLAPSAAPTPQGMDR